jgi:hypothetical protein
MASMPWRSMMEVKSNFIETTSFPDYKVYYKRKRKKKQYFGGEDMVFAASFL